jgi:ferredoxin
MVTEEQNMPPGGAMKSVGTIVWEFANGALKETPAYAPLNVLGHAEIFELVIPQACGGQAECGTCRVQVLLGEVSAMLGDERDLRRDHPQQFSHDERLACRARPRGDVRIKLRARRAKDLRDETS